MKKAGIGVPIDDTAAAYEARREGLKSLGTHLRSAATQASDPTLAAALRRTSTAAEALAAKEVPVGKGVEDGLLDALNELTRLCSGWG